MVCHESSDAPQCWGIETVISSELYLRFEPELRFSAGLSDVNMSRLAWIALVCIEEKFESVQT